MDTIFTGLITSKMRIRIIMRLFLNPKQESYLRELVTEFDVSPSQVKKELQQLRKTGLLSSSKNGRSTHYRANESHPLYPELHSMVKKALGMDRIVESIIERLGNLEMAILVDDYARGKDTGIVDLVLIGNIDENNLSDLKKKTESYIQRKIRTLVLTRDEYLNHKETLDTRPQLLLWSKN